MPGWFEELERDHDEQLVLLDRIEVAIEALRLAEARHAVARLEQKLARHFAWEEEHVHGTIAGRLLPHERRAVDAVEQEHDELTEGFARLRYAVRGVLPSRSSARRSCSCAPSGTTRSASRRSSRRSTIASPPPARWRSPDERRPGPRERYASVDRPSCASRIGRRSS